MLVAGCRGGECCVSDRTAHFASASLTERRFPHLPSDQAKRLSYACCWIQALSLLGQLKTNLHLSQNSFKALMGIHLTFALHQLISMLTLTGAASFNLWVLHLSIRHHLTSKTKLVLRGCSVKSFNRLILDL
jgi:hypothetical protein